MNDGSKTVSPRLLIPIVLLIGVSVGFGVSYLYFQPRFDMAEMSLVDTSEELSVAEGRVEQLQSKLREADLETAKLEVETSMLERLLSVTNATLSSTANELAGEKAELEKALTDLRSATEQSAALTQATASKDREIALMEKQVATMEKQIASIEEVALKLENDKKLLVYLRMETPDSRQEATEFWKEFKAVATESEPTLRFYVDRIVSNMDAYFLWIEMTPPAGASLSEIGAWVLSMPLGAQAYLEAIESFRREALLVVITDLSAAVAQIT